MNTPAKIGKKKCANPSCGLEFAVLKIGQKVCSIACALATKVLNQDRAKKAIKSQKRAEHRQAKEKIKTRAEHMREAQQAFNAWIRMRDVGEPCISCGRHHNGQWQAGHYRTVGGNPELRFEPLNCHRQCAPCNNHLSGNLIGFRISLLQKIGEEKVIWLEGPHEPKKYSIDELKEIKASYRAKVRELKASLIDGYSVL